MRPSTMRRRFPPSSRSSRVRHWRDRLSMWLIGRLVEDVIETSDAHIENGRITSAGMVLGHSHRLVLMSELLTHQLQQLATYLREEVYYHPEKLVMEQKARRIIHGLFDAFAGEPRLLPRPVQERLDGTEPERVVCG